jgi:hypothetical protein
VALAWRIGVAFDSRQVGFESYTFIVLLLPSGGVCKQRASEHDWERMKELVRGRVRERSRPDQLIRYTVEVEIGGGASANRYQSLDQGECRVKAPKVIFRPRGQATIQVIHAIPSAGSTFDVIAVFEMADLIGEGDIV